MKLGWGKAVPIPAQPVYVPPKLLELTLPPPASGLPFNAQPDAKDVNKLPPPGTAMSVLMKNDRDKFDDLVQNSVVKVVTPTDRPLLCLIHRMVEFVAKEGPMFEAMIMNREISNPMFRFLFDNQSSAHIYYRWRLFSVLQGEHHQKWRSEPFRMFKGGSLWKPPPVNLFAQGMPEELIERSPEHQSDSNLVKSSAQSGASSSGGTKTFRESKESKKGTLNEKQRDQLEDILRNLTPERAKIQEAMIFCLEHADAAEEVVTCITESLTLDETPLHRKVARLYLVSDILHNCTAKVANVSHFRQGFQTTLNEIFESVHKSYASIEGRLKAEHFKQRVMNCFKVWEDWTLYSSDFLIRLQNIFLGLTKQANESAEVLVIGGDTIEDIDGKPIEDGEIVSASEEDIDGVPMQNASEPLAEKKTLKFKPSRWETIDPQLIEKQAMTSSRLDELDELNSKSKPIESRATDVETIVIDDEDIDGKPISDAKVKVARDKLVIQKLKNLLNWRGEERRQKLRQIELLVVKYQDDLEAKVAFLPDDSITQKVNEMRIRLLKKCVDGQIKKNGSTSRSRSSSPSACVNRKRSHSRSPLRSSRRR